MIYTELTEKAARLAFKAHEGQFDRAGLPYVMHPIHLAEMMTTEDTCVAALLHDVVEDTDITIEDLREEGFTETQLRAVDLLTHKKGVPYMDYVRALKDDPVARSVKIADLRHNSDRSRLREATQKDEERYKKYKEALSILGAEL